MATIKSYTDLQQSKKLAEILPIESADMWYDNDGESTAGRPEVRYGSFVGLASKNIPCWSLAALLGVIPKRIKHYNVLRIDISENDTSIWYDEIGYNVNNDLPDITKDNPVDACVDMIIKLYEINSL